MRPTPSTIWHVQQLHSPLITVCMCSRGYLSNLVISKFSSPIKTLLASVFYIPYCKTRGSLEVYCARTDKTMDSSLSFICKADWKFPFCILFMKVHPADSRWSTLMMWLTSQWNALTKLGFQATLTIFQFQLTTTVHNRFKISSLLKSVIICREGNIIYSKL